MRISDVSSDVCSSDLCLRWCGFDSARPRHGGGNQNLDFRADADPTRHADVPAGLLGEVAHLEQAEAGAALAFGREERLEDLLENVGRNATAGIGHRHADIRSEEHTSELQSLMRISYAVFCLKKKTRRQALNAPTTNYKNTI